jgi:peptide/nickel transport system permease protein
VSVAFLSFAIVALAPGDPALLIAGEGASAEYIEEVRRAYGLDRPITEQALLYVTNLFKGEWGLSVAYSRPALTVILERLPQTLLLVGTALTLAIYLGIKIGVASARKSHRTMDNLLSVVTLVLYSIPVFWLGLILILAFSLYIPILPSGGMFSIGAERSLLTLIPSVIWHMILPVITLSSFFLAIYARLTRSGMMDILSSNFILAAKAKGLPQDRILYRHALRNALIPIVAVAGVQFGIVVSGVVLTETVYSWPGMGSLLVQAVSYRDYPLVTGILVITSLAVAVSNFIADLIIAYLDPRVRTQITGR